MSFHRHPFFVFATGAVLALGAIRARGDVLFSDNFNNVPLSGNLNGRAPTINLLNKTWAGSVTNLLGDGNGSLAGVAGTNTGASLDLGADYLSTNKGVYELSLSITQPSGNAGLAWIGLGFSQFGAATNNLVGNEGAPWMLFRLNGAVNVYGGPDTQNQLVGTTASTTVGHTFKLTLDTSTPQWTLNAFVDSTQLDLNGSTAGLTYTYPSDPPSNPTTSRFVTFATGMNGLTPGTATVDNFSLTGPTPVPEPQAALLVAGVVAMVGGASRRRRRVVV